MRPWRLTRRQRVEMESALLVLRGTEGGVHDGLDALGVRGSRGSCFCAEADVAVEAAAVASGTDSRHAWTMARRLLRARVAIALRAALRADEDARCEEACDAFLARIPSDHERYDEMQEIVIEYHDALREWSHVRSVPYEWPEGVEPPLSVRTITIPGVGRMVLASRVPLALWERSPHPVTDKPG